MNTQCIVIFFILAATFTDTTQCMLSKPLNPSRKTTLSSPPQHINNNTSSPAPSKDTQLLDPSVSVDLPENTKQFAVVLSKTAMMETPYTRMGSNSNMVALTRPNRSLRSFLEKIQQEENQNAMQLRGVLKNHTQGIGTLSQWEKEKK